MKALFLIGFLLLTGTVFGQDAKVQTVQIQTNAECGACKKRIEEKLNYTKGVKFAELDLTNKVLTVKFTTKQISLDEVKKTVSEIGYNADEVKANKTAQENLPACCKPNGMKK